MSKLELFMEPSPTEMIESIDGLLVDRRDSRRCRRKCRLSERFRMGFTHVIGNAEYVGVSAE